MDRFSTSQDFDQSFPSMLKSELAKQHSLIDLDDSTSLSQISNRQLQIPENSESTTHCIKVYRDQLETLQKDNFSLKLQLYYFQRAFESAGISDLPQVTEYKEEFIELEKELLRNRCSLTEAKEAISQLTNQNIELQKQLSKFDRKSYGCREKVDEITTKLNEKEDALDTLQYQYRELLDHNNQYELRFDELVDQVSTLKKTITSLNGQSIAQTENNLGHMRKLSEADKNLKILQEKNSKIIEFAKPLAHKLQETQEELELTVQRCGDLSAEILLARNSYEQSEKKCSDLEEQLSNLLDRNNVISKQCNDLTNAKLDFESVIHEHSSENMSLKSNLKDYEGIIEDLTQRLAKNSDIVESLRSEGIATKHKLAELSRNEESLIQSKLIITNLENKIENFMREINRLQEINSDQNFRQEISSLNEKLSHTQSENLSLCQEIKAQSYLLQNEIDKNNDLNLINEASAFKSLKTLDVSSQTLLFQDNIDSSSIIRQNKLKSAEISELLQKINCLESENKHLVVENETLQSMDSKMVQLNEQNSELLQQVNQIQMYQSGCNELDITNIKSDLMAAQLQMVQVLSQSNDALHLGNVSEGIQNVLTDLVDQLSVSKESLTTSLKNERQLQLNLTRLEENYQTLLMEKSNTMAQVSESEKRIGELTRELNATKSSYQNKLESAHEHINELQSIMLPNRKVSPLQKLKFPKSIAESELLFSDQTISKYSINRAIPRSSSTPCISELSPVDSEEIEFHPNSLFIYEQHQVPGKNNEDSLGGIPDVIVPDKESLKKALQTGSTNLALLLSIYKELLTTQKYLSRAKRYTLASQSSSFL